MNIRLFLLLCNVATFCFCSEPTNVGFFSTANTKKQENTLTITTINEHDFCGLYDGHGGPEVAERLRDSVHVLFKQALLEGKTKKESFSYAFNTVDNAIMFEKQQAGATALAVYLEEGTASIAWVGDVHAVLDFDNTITFATKAHTLANNQEFARVIEAKGKVFREAFPTIKTESGCSSVGPWLINGLPATRVIGNTWEKGKLDNYGRCFSQPLRMTDGHWAYARLLSGGRIVDGEKAWSITPLVGQVIAEPEYIEIVLNKKNRWLIIVSKSVSDFMRDEEMVTIVEHFFQSGLCLNDIAEKLVKMAIERESLKNITVIIIDLLSRWRG